MRQRLTSGTDIAMHWLYDPAAFPSDVADPIKGGKWKTLREEGRLLANCTGADGDVVVELVVDEEPSADLRERAKPLVEGALLRVPSGRLRFGGAEEATPQYLAAAGPSVGDADLRIAPGNYRVDVFSTPEKRTDTARLLRDLGGTITLKEWQQYNNLLGWGCLSVVGLAILAAFGIAVAWPLWRWTGVAAIVGAVVAIGFVLQLVRKARLRHPKMVEAARVYKLVVAADEGSPPTDSMIVLRRMPDDVDVSRMRGERTETVAMHARSPRGRARRSSTHAARPPIDRRPA